MNKTMIIPLALMSLVGVGCDENILDRRVNNSPLEVKVVNASNPEQEAKVKALEDRVKTLENWAVKMGAKFK